MDTQSSFINKYSPVIEPLYDTWRIKKSAGYWGIDGQLEWRNFNIHEINNWYAESLIKSLDSFSSFARIWSVNIINGGESRGEIGYDLKLKSHSSYNEYIQNVIATIKQYSIPIYEIRIQLDMFIFVRTNASPNKPIRSWVRYLGELYINVDSEEENAYLWLNMEHTLFYPFSYIGNQDNYELFELNQPLLEKALRSWEKKFNSSIDVEGLPGIYKYGFLPDDQW